MKVGNMVKKLLSVFATLALVIGLVPTFAFAATVTPMPIAGYVYLDGTARANRAPADMFSFEIIHNAAEYPDEVATAPAGAGIIKNVANGTINWFNGLNFDSADSTVYHYVLKQVPNENSNLYDLDNTVYNVVIYPNLVSGSFATIEVYKPGSAYKVSEINFYNTTKPPAQKSQLTIKKEVNFINLIPPDVEFEFEVIIGGEKVTPNPTIKAGGSWTSEEFEEGTEYSIQEINIPKHFEFVKTSVGEDILVQGNFEAEDTEIIYTNEYWSLSTGEFPEFTVTPDKSDNSKEKDSTDEKKKTTILAQTGDINDIWRWICVAAFAAIVFMVVYYFKDSN